jgi:hypothetical protein
MSCAAPHESRPGGTPRQPVLALVEAELPADMLAVLRLKRFDEAGKPRQVEEFAVFRVEGGDLVVRAAFDQAAAQRFDLTILSPASWEELGLVFS